MHRFTEQTSHSDPYRFLSAAETVATPLPIHAHIDSSPELSKSVFID